MTAQRTEKGLEKAMLLACEWLVQIAQVHTERIPPEENLKNHPHRTWRGAIRGNYSVADKKWDFTCPIWHAGQAIKALVLAHRITGAPWLIDAAKESAQFIGAERDADERSDDFGLLYAYEDYGDLVNTSAILETVGGLFELSSATGEQAYRQWAVAALDWVVRKCYMPGKGLFRDLFSTGERRFVEKPGWGNLATGAPGRPLLDDGAFLTAYQLTDRPQFRQVFFEVAQTLLDTEEPPGNWIWFNPCGGASGYLHPRQAYWWGLPMIAAWQVSNEERYLQCAIRAADWYCQALRHDGGMIRGTYRDFSAESFGHATSGTACAAILFRELMAATGRKDWEDPMNRALHFCLDMQLRDTADPNLRGVILEKVLPPDGTDRHPFYIRDLGTIFFIQAAALALLDSKDSAARP